MDTEAEIGRMLDEGCPHHDPDEVRREVDCQGWVELDDGSCVELPVVETIDLADARRDPKLAAFVDALWGN